MKIIKSVSLNEKNEQDQRILKAIKRRNFSGFAKKCILEHLDRLEKEKQQQTPPSEPKRVKGSGAKIEINPKPKLFN